MHSSAAVRAVNAQVGAGYGYAAVDVAFVDARVDGVGWTPAVCRRRLTLLRLTPWAAAREAVVAPLR
jgi:hypothetical protein